MEKMEVEKNVAQNSKSDFQTQLEESLKNINVPEAGQMVEGIVVQITEDYVYVDIGDKSEGLIPVKEFAEGLPVEGDTVRALLIGHDKNGPVLSKKKADSKRFLKEIQQAAKDKTPVNGTIVKLVKSGYEVNLGIDKPAFLPISQADSEKIEKPESLIGVKSKFYIERLYSDGKVNPVVNRRKYLEEEINTKRDAFFNSIQLGDNVKGTVKSFTSFGAFIDLGGFDGLLHINDMSWGHVARPKDFVKKGQEIELKVIRLDPAEKRINLSLKHFSEDPWIHFDDKYNVNKVVKGKVTKLTKFGAFVELEEGIDGFLHGEDISWLKKVKHPGSELSVDQEVEAVVLECNPEAHKIKIGIKQLTPDPWKEFAAEYKPGSTLEGEITSITEFGVFVKAPNGIEGLVNKFNLSENKEETYEDAVAKYKVGDKINVFVVDVNAAKEKVAFSVKEFKKKQAMDEISHYMSSSANDDDGAFTLADMINSKKQ